MSRPQQKPPSPAPAPDDRIPDVRTEAENAALKAQLRECKEKLQATFDRAASLAKELDAERTHLMNEVKEARVLSKEVSEMQLELLRLARDKPEKDVSRHLLSSSIRH